MILVFKGIFKSGTKYDKGDIVVDHCQTGKNEQYVCIKEVKRYQEFEVLDQWKEHFAPLKVGQYERYFFEKEDGMKKKVQKTDEAPKTLKEMKEDLKKIQPQGDEGTAIVHVQAAGISVSVPIPPIPAVQDALKKVGLKNRTLLDVGGVKVGLDII